MSLKYFARKARPKALVPKRNPLEPPDYDEVDVQALRAIARGDATAYQQRRAIEWLVEAFGTYDMSFRAESPRLTDFAEGRRSAGQTLVWMLLHAPAKTDSDTIAVRGPYRIAEHFNASEQG